MPPDVLQPNAYFTNLIFSRSYLHRQVSPPETLVVKGGTTWARNGRWILPENAQLPRNILGSFTCRKSTTWDKRFYFPSEGKRAEDFFPLKNPTASAGFELANLGTKGQHASSRPPKPLFIINYYSTNFIVFPNFRQFSTSWFTRIETTTLRLISLRFALILLIHLSLDLVSSLFPSRFYQPNLSVDSFLPLSPKNGR